MNRRDAPYDARPDTACGAIVFQGVADIILDRREGALRLNRLAALAGIRKPRHALRKKRAHGSRAMARVRTSCGCAPDA